MNADTSPPAGGPITDALKHAIEASGMAHNTLAKAAGVERMSITRFVRGERTLRVSVADKLAAYFGLELRPVKRAKGA